jgi:hypothetical protein
MVRVKTEKKASSDLNKAPRHSLKIEKQLANFFHHDPDVFTCHVQRFVLLNGHGLATLSLSDELSPSLAPRMEFPLKMQSKLITDHKHTYEFVFPKFPANGWVEFIRRKQRWTGVCLGPLRFALLRRIRDSVRTSRKVGSVIFPRSFLHCTSAKSMNCC